MIRYALKCAEGHSFDAWYQNSAAYDRLAASGHITCAVCGGTDVEKSVMAPRVATDRAPNPGSRMVWLDIGVGKGTQAIAVMNYGSFRPECGPKPKRA